MKQFLLPVDDSKNSIHALQYMSMMSPLLQEFIYMLFYVQPTISDYLVAEAKNDPNALEKFKQLDEKNTTLGNNILNRYKEWLMRLNVPEERIKLLTQRRKEGVARDILQQAWSELVDAITIGRRGFSKFQDIFIGSTTKNVIEHNGDIPVWIVDGLIISKEILFAVDGSTDSFKALEYLCDMLRQSPDVKLTIFHVQPSLRDFCGIELTAMQNAEDEELVTNVFEKANRHCIKDFMEHAWRKLKEKEIDGDRLKVKTQASKFNIGKAIVNEFKNGKYGTLVVGRRGVNKSFFMGSVSHYLITHLENGALWVVS